MVKINTNLTKLSAKSASVISPNVKKDELYLDTAKATPLEQDMVAQFTAIQKSLSALNTQMKKAVSQKQVKGNYATLFTAWAKKCNKQSTAAGNRLKGLKDKYTADVQEYTIKLLSDRIAELEAKIAKMGESTTAASETTTAA